jgi:putative transposase
MAEENRLWGAERIRGELLKLGIRVAKRTVQRYMLKGAGIRVLRAAVRAPLMNSVCERFLGSVRRECLDPLIILSERQLQHVLADYALNYFNTARPHQGIGQRIPVPDEPVQAQVAGSVMAIPVLGGLHHDYRAAA